MKGFAQCPIVEDSNLLNQLIERLLDLEDTQEFTDITDEAGKAIAVVLRSDRSCNSHVKSRTAVRFADNEDLLAAHEGLKEAEKDVERLQQETAEAIKRMNAMERQRWDIAVKEFGLNPDAHFYAIDEENGAIEQKDLDCNSCKGKTMVRKMRQHIAEQVLQIGKRLAKEAKDDGTGEGDAASTAPEGHAEERGEVSSAEQEVSGMADQPDSAGDDGDNGVAETD